MGDALDIHQDRARIGIARQHVEHVAEIDIGHVTHRDQVREADALGRAPVGQCGQHRARLRHRGDAAEGATGGAAPEEGDGGDALTLAMATSWLEGIESVDLSDIVTGHCDYRSKLEAVMQFLEFET